MQLGVCGLLSGVLAVATAERMGHQNPSGQGQGHVIQQPSEAGIALTLRVRREETEQQPTEKSKSVPTYPNVPSLPPWDPGGTGLHAPKAATQRVAQFLSRRGNDLVYRNSAQQTLN